jgi:DNA-binding NtrC family response regulator
MTAPAETRVLVVDDEEVARESLKAWLEDSGYATDVAADAKQALMMLEARRYTIALIDVRMKGMDGIELTRRIRSIDPTIDVIVITAFASAETAVLALKLGACDYLTKPFDAEDLCRRIETCAARSREARDVGAIVPPELPGEGWDAIVTGSPAMQAVVEQAKDVAASDIAVLIEGEPGTGKDLVARTIHRQSTRHFMLFVPVTCGGISDELLESEFFGHERGAFPGATLRKTGSFELADGGTLFLDDIAAMSSRMQIELLRVLKQKQFLRVGGTRPMGADFRLISGTSGDLDALVRQNAFCHDLFHRASRIRLRIPPLRERGEDVVLLAHRFLARSAALMSRGIDGFSPEALDALRRYPWPGNVGELENTVERAVVVERSTKIGVDSLRIGVPTPPAAPRPGRQPSALVEAERRHVLGVLESEQWDLTRSADALEVSRVELDALIAKHGLKPTP